MKKLVIFLMVSAVLVFVLAACKREATDSTKTATDNSADDTLGDEVSMPTVVADDLPAMDFGGYDFRVLTWPEEGGEHTIIAPEEQNGDILNDSIYNANKVVEERFNVKIEEIIKGRYHEAPAMLKNAVQAGDDAYDMVLMVDRLAMDLAMSGRYFCSMNELPNVNLDKPYWDKFINEALSLEGTLYFASGANMMGALDYMCFLVYNKEVVKDEGIENIHNLVQSGNWTMDKMYELGRMVTRDTDGDGEYTDTDRYGVILSSDYYYPSFWYANRIPLIAKDEHDLPYFNVPGNNKLFDIFDKQYDLAHSGNVEFDVTTNKLPHYVGSVAGHPIGIVMRIFADGHGLFASSSMYAVQALRAMDADYGIIPYPTYDAQPADTPYAARVTGLIPLVVPTTNTDLNMTSALMEALACAYYLNVIPKYYDLVVQEKATRDDESRDMLDMLIANRFFDLGDSIWMGDARAQYTGLAAAKSNTFVSTTEKIESKVKATLEKSIDAFREANESN
ncbi:MAG: hypothetical protein FWH48_06625 [Oscillospiraceae bacterium]|nr:hypothetical protein [Oscillospiraceae bacterium]